MAPWFRSESGGLFGLPSSHEDQPLAHVLLVEDHEATRASVRRTLERSGYEVQEAGDPYVAVELVRAQPGRFDLVICDVVLPRMNGLALGQLLTEGGYRGGVLFVSGYVAGEVLEHAGLAPGARFLPKPFTVESLLTSVAHALELPGRPM